jgi:hypothetical protein
MMLSLGLRVTLAFKLATTVTVTLKRHSHRTCSLSPEGVSGSDQGFPCKELKADLKAAQVFAECQTK